MKHNLHRICSHHFFCGHFPYCCKKQDPNPAGSGQGKLAKQFDSKVATDWFTLLTDITRSTPYNPSAKCRIFAYSGLALYESVARVCLPYGSIYTHSEVTRFPSTGKRIIIGLLVLMPLLPGLQVVYEEIIQRLPPGSHRTA
jgi:hypothetical protein